METTREQFRVARVACIGFVALGLVTVLAVARPATATNGCTSNSDCDDGNDCNGIYICSPEGVCILEDTLGEGEACDDHNPCTVDTTCVETDAGLVCGGGSLADSTTPCDDGNPCTVNDQCGDNGACDVSTIAPAGTPCDDGDPCTINDACPGPEVGATCSGGGLNPQCGCCQVAFATSIFGQVAASEFLLQWCSGPTTADICQNEVGGQFVQGATCNGETGQCELAAVCGNGTVDTGEDCEPQQGQDPACGCNAQTCTYPAAGTNCDDGNACTTGEVCDGAGSCSGGATLNCDDNNPCTTDTCDPQQGCQHTPNQGQQCDDGDLCTENDACSAEGTCEGTPKSCQQASPPCEAGEACDSQTGQCEALADPPSTTPCDLDQNVCTTDRCDGAGSCVFVENAQAGTSCDDGLFCTGTDTCNGNGVCEHSGDPCVGGSECNQTCNEASDNCFDPAGTACSEDGLVCTDDACNGAGACTHTALPVHQCPKGYVLLEAPSDAAVTAEVAYTAQANDGSACAEKVRLKQASLLDGNAVGHTGIQVGKDATANGTCVTSGPPVTFGANGQCTSGTDTTGMHSLLGDCQGASDKAEQRRQALLALSANATNGSVTINSNTTLDVTPYSSSPGAVVVIDYAALTIGLNRTLTIKGNANTEAVILRIAGNFRARKGSKLVTQGISAGPNGSPAERVLLLVGGTTEVRMNATVDGTIFSQGQATVRRDAVLNGALISPASPLRVRPSAIVNHKPWVLW